MRFKCLLPSFVVLGLVGCCPKVPPTTSPNLKTADAPGKGQVDVEIRGLVAFIPNGQGETSLFLSPSGMAHTPLLAVDARALDKTTPSTPDWVAALPDGGGLAIWQFTELEPDPMNVVDSNQPIKRNVDPLGPNEKDYSKLRWIPFMEDIFGKPQTLDSLQVAKAAASGQWLFGSMSAVFDPPVGNRDHKNEKWKIGNRINHVADAVRVRFDLVNLGQPLTLHLVRNGTPETILVKEMSTVYVAGYPTVLNGKDFDHFKHFYDLRVGGYPGSNYDPMLYVTPPNFNTTRCTPIKFP